MVSLAVTEDQWVPLSAETQWSTRSPMDAADQPTRVLTESTSSAEVVTGPYHVVVPGAAMVS